MANCDSGFDILHLVGKGVLLLAGCLLVGPACVLDVTVDEPVSLDPDAGQPTDDAMAQGADAAGSDAVAMLDTTCLTDNAGAIVCDGWESGDLTTVWDGSNTKLGTIEASTAQAYRGDYSLRIATEGPGSTAFVRVAFAPITAGTINLRGYLYVPATTTFLGSVEFTTLGPGGGTHAHNNIVSGGRGRILLSGMTATTAAALPTDQWICFTYDIAIGDLDGTASGTFGGETLGPIGPLDSLPAGGYENVEIGFVFTDDMMGAAEVFIDEVVVDDSPIACDP